MILDLYTLPIWANVSGSTFVESPDSSGLGSGCMTLILAPLAPFVHDGLWPMSFCTASHKVFLLGAQVRRFCSFNCRTSSESQMARAGTECERFCNASHSIFVLEAKASPAPITTSAASLLPDASVDVVVSRRLRSGGMTGPCGSESVKSLLASLSAEILAFGNANVGMTTPSGRRVLLGSDISPDHEWTTTWNSTSPVNRGKTTLAGFAARAQVLIN
mmetsp:Transcript_99106/g.190273  ORF Transcript_99106/g.190273 Transcript_99106/m.190273 type:complete len:218 (+) Transcript_99106:627-1280(+)